MLIAEHSMCQPGRPRPKDASHCAQLGSSPLNFHRTKSRASLLVVLVGVDAHARLDPDTSSRDEAAVRREGGDAEVDAAVHGVGVAPRHEPLDERHHLGNVLGGAGA